jgi:hypothetical protein
MSCILILGEDLEKIQPLVQELQHFFCVFSLGPLAGGQTKNLNLDIKLLLPSGTYVQSIVPIAPAVTKRALLTDDNDDGRHVIA